MKKQDKDMRIVIEARREEMLRNGEEAKKLHREGKLKSFDNAKDLMNSLLED